MQIVLLLTQAMAKESSLGAWLRKCRPGALEAMKKLGCDQLWVRNVTHNRMRLVPVVGAGRTFKLSDLKAIGVAETTFDRQVDCDEVTIVLDWLPVYDDKDP